MFSLPNWEIRLLMTVTLARQQHSFFAFLFLGGVSIAPRETRSPRVDITPFSEGARVGRNRASAIARQAAPRRPTPRQESRLEQEPLNDVPQRDGQSL
jgi:hypothetical protein